MARSMALVMVLLMQVAFLTPTVLGATNSTTTESIFEPTQKTNLGGSILAVVAVLVGGALLTFGYRFLYEALFAISFAVGGVVLAVLAESMLAEKTWVVIGSWIAFILGGLLCGGAVLWTNPKSSFVAGMAAGITLAVMATNSAAYIIFPGHTHELFQTFCVVFGVVFVAFDLKFGKPVQIAATSIFGSGILVWGVGFFVGEFPFPNNLEAYAEQDASGKLAYALPAVWWGYLLGAVLLSVFGFMIQFRKTARNTVIDDEFAGFDPNGFGYPIDAYAYDDSDKAKGVRPSVPVMDQFANTARESDYLPSSYRSAAHESFCRLYSRNTEAMSIEKTRAKFLEARAQSIDTKNPMETKSPALKPVKNISSRGTKVEGKSKENEF